LIRGHGRGIAGDGDLPVDHAFQGARLGGVGVLPVDDTGRLAGRDRGRGRVDGQQVARLVELLEEVDTGSDVISGATVREGCQNHAVETRARLGGVAVECDHAGVLGLEQVGDGARQGHASDVAADGHEARVVADPQAVRVLELVGDIVPGRDLVGSVEVGIGEGDGRTHVQDVWSGVRAREIVDGVDLFLARCVRLRRLHLDAVFGLEVLDHLAVVGPIGRQGDDVEGAFLLGGGDEALHAAEVLGRGRGRGVGLGECRDGGGGHEDRCRRHDPECAGSCPVHEYLLLVNQSPGSSSTLALTGRPWRRRPPTISGSRQLDSAASPTLAPAV
jgi:hypothetical protein